MADIVANGAQPPEPEMTAPRVAAPIDWETHKPLSFRARTLFATGDAVDGIVNFGVVSFLLYYLTAVCGVPGTMAGVIFALATVLDAIADPLIGSVSDNTRSRWGRRLPYMLASAVPAALLFALLFSLPHLKPAWLLAVYAGFLLLALRVAMSTFTLPYAALGAELCTDYNERSTLFAFRWFFNCFGNLLMFLLAFMVWMKGRDGLMDREAYVGFGWSSGVIALAAALTACLAAKPLLARLRPIEQPRYKGLGSLAAEFREVAANRSFWILFICVLLFWTAVGVSSTLGLHANLYFWRLPSALIAALPLINLAGFGLGIPLVALALRRFEKRTISAAGLAITCISLGVPAPLKILGLLPSGQPLLLILATGAFLGGLAGTFALVSWGSMMADAADEHEHLFGSRREGLYFAGISLSFKAAAGLGGLISGVALDVIRFPQGVAAIDADRIAPETLRDLGLVHGPLAALLGLVGALVLVAYRLDRKAVARIQVEIAARRAGPSATPPGGAGGRGLSS
jgi:glycoside/pentoside/hexuronide:cation symporter, GPH family